MNRKQIDLKNKAVSAILNNSIQENVNKIIHNLINSIFKSFHITDDMNMFPLSFATHKSRSAYELDPMLYLINDEDCYYYNDKLKEWNRSSIKKEKLVPSLIKLNVKDFT